MSFRARNQLGHGCMHPGGQVLSPMAFDGAMCMFKFHGNIDQFRIKQRKANLFEFYIKMLANGSVDETTMEQELLNYLWGTLNFDDKLRKVIWELGHTLNYV
jgi:hypothetical protein